ncbi:unnamed protein product [Microthlaspi erraticum]|uniref:Uncharacterized protein n=1 Tax=Microthlaspi erraticum TaxID=1685480 RepID=A0A6D2K0A8_9BRAS|nr:unnamed protein product [Microthlaspi erraticum]
MNKHISTDNPPRLNLHRPCDTPSQGLKHPKGRDGKIKALGLEDKGVRFTLELLGEDKDELDQYGEDTQLLRWSQNRTGQSCSNIQLLNEDEASLNQLGNDTSF